MSGGFARYLLLPALIACLLPLAQPAAAQAATGTVSGCVAIAGQSEYRGVAALWPAGPDRQPPDPRRAIRPPSASAPLRPDGCFTLSVAPGRYFVGAIARRAGGPWQGPPQPGDRVFLSPDDTGGSCEVTVAAGTDTNLGRHDGSWEYAGFTAAGPRISGRVTAEDGRPLAGMLVFAFADDSLSGDPLAVSEPADGDGRYLLRLPAPGTVYLRARENYGRRAPTEGGRMGVYGGRTAQPVTVPAAGDGEPRDIVTILVPAAAERRRGADTGPGEGQRVR